MSYKKIEPSDIALITQHIVNNERICDFTIGTLYGWRSFYDFLFCVDNGSMYIKSLRDNCFLPPFDQKVDKFVEHIGKGALVSPVPQDMLPLFAKYGKAEKLENWSDYLYNTQDLITLEGKKYHGKRNFIKRFESNYSWTFEQITGKDLDEVEQFVRALELRDVGETAQYEHLATIETLSQMQQLNMFGAVLRVEGKIVGFSMGEINGDTLFVHTERANREYVGSYEKLANTFVSKFGKSVQYVNREEDLGIEGLRKAKESYRPIALLDKYTVTIE